MTTDETVPWGPCVTVACVAGGIVGAREIKIWRRSREKYRLPENLGILNTAHFYHLIDLNWSQLIQPIRADNFLTKYRRKGDRVTFVIVACMADKGEFAKGDTRTAS